MNAREVLLGVVALGLACAVARADEWLVSMGSRGCVRDAPVWLVLDDAFRFKRWPTREIDEASELAKLLDPRSPEVERRFADCIEKQIAVSRDGRRELVARRDAARQCRTELVIRDLDARSERVVPLCADIVEWPPAELIADLDPALGARVWIRRGAWSTDERTAALIVWSGGGFSGRSTLLRVDLTTGTVREHPLDPSRGVLTVRPLRAK